MKMGSLQEKAMMKNWHYNNGSFQNVQRGEYDINGKQMYFRSKWEANISLYLDFLVNQGEIKDWKEEYWDTVDGKYHYFCEECNSKRGGNACLGVMAIIVLAILIGLIII